MTEIDRGLLWKLFVEDLPDIAMVILGVDGKILGWNLGASSMLGYSASDVVGQNFSCLYTFEDNAGGKPAKALARAVAQGHDMENSRRVRRDGTLLEAHGVLMPLRDPQNDLVGFGCMMRDTTSTTQPAATSANSASSVPGPKKILIVDDNAQILEGLELQLTGLGYKVVRAASGADALDILVRVADIDLLCTDVIMPGGMNGSQLAEEARIIRPGLKVLYTSGYFQNALVRDRIVDASISVLAKPYRKHELAKRITEALAG